MRSVTLAVLAIAAVTAAAQDESAVKPNPTRDVYFGNLHVHTGWSFDAYINGALDGS